MKKLLIVLGALALAVGVQARFILLTISFEYDEIFTAITSNPATAFSYIWKHFLIVDVHPPLHNMLLWIYNHFVPYGPEWILRLPSLILSLLGLFLAWKLFPRYLPRIARYFFVLMLSCNFYLLLYAQHARVYSLMLCLAIVLTFLYLNMARFIRHKKGIPTKWWIIYTTCSILLCWSHYFGALLFGLLSAILLVCAWKYKQPLRRFIIVPFLVLLVFLPWIIPNFFYNLFSNRFSGNWWGNRPLSWNLITLWIEFFFSSRKAFYVLASLTGAGLLYSILRFKRKKVFPFYHEIILTFIPMAAALLFAFVMSFKIFWLLWRYFIPFIPCLYLFISLILSPLCKRYRFLGLIFLCFVGLSLHAFIRLYPYFQKGTFFPARASMQLYKDAFADKDLYVIAMEAFPVESMPLMYSFYPKHYLHMDRSVYELFYMDPQQREELLKKWGSYLLWMPNCDPDKMKKLSQTFQRNMFIFAHYEGSCFILPAGEDRRTFDSDLQTQYMQRFRQYVQKLDVKN